MAISHSDSTRNVIADSVCSSVSEVVIQNSANSVLVTIPLTFNTASGGVATASSISPVTASVTGVASKFEARNNSGQKIFGGSVSDDGSGDLDLDNTSINSGQTVQLNSASYTAPA